MLEHIAILDDKARCIWINNEPRGMEGKVLGATLGDFCCDRSRAVLHEAMYRAAFRSEPVRYDLWNTLAGDAREYECELRRIKRGSFVVISREKPRQLTEREHQVLVALCNDEPAKATARRLGISIKTVESFRGILKRKTGARGLAGLVKWALRAGLTDL